MLQYMNIMLGILFTTQWYFQDIYNHIQLPCQNTWQELPQSFWKKESLKVSISLQKIYTIIFSGISTYIWQVTTVFKVHDISWYKLIMNRINLKSNLNLSERESRSGEKGKSLLISFPIPVDQLNSRAKKMFLNWKSKRIFLSVRIF